MMMMIILHFQLPYNHCKVENQDWCKSIIQYSNGHTSTTTSGTGRGGGGQVPPTPNSSSIIHKTRKEAVRRVVVCGEGRTEAKTANLCRKYQEIKYIQRYCNGTRPIYCYTVLLRGLTTPPGITSRWREIQMLTEVSVHMK
jgi:hypothetical protein